MVVWDDHKNAILQEIKFRSPVLGIKLVRGRMAAILESQIYLYNLSTFRLVDQFSTLPNPRALCVLTTHEERMVLACPSLSLGNVHVEICDQKGGM